MVIPVAEQTSKLLSKVAPIAFDSLNLYNTEVEDCHLGKSVWSGFTGVIDGEVRNHKDNNNHPCGATCVINLLATKSKKGQAHDEKTPGLVIMLQHGLILFETAKHENHATTRIDDANPDDPSRIGIILFQHQKLDRPNHNRLEKEMPDEHAAIDEEEPIPSTSGNKNAKDARAIKDKYKNDLLSGLGC